MESTKEFNQIEYNNKYNKENYDRTTLMTRKGIKQEWQKAAKEKGISLNQYLLNAIEKGR